jgi:hypothetical protein
MLFRRGRAYTETWHIPGTYRVRAGAYGGLVGRDRRIQTAGAIHHVYSRGNRREVIYPPRLRLPPVPALPRRRARQARLAVPRLRADSQPLPPGDRDSGGESLRGHAPAQSALGKGIQPRIPPVRPRLSESFRFARRHGRTGLQQPPSIRHAQSSQRGTVQRCARVAWSSYAEIAGAAEPRWLVNLERLGELLRCSVAEIPARLATLLT